jgi:hypothetical protein
MARIVTPRQRILLCAVLLAGAGRASGSFADLPRHIVWRGTLTTTQGLTADMHARGRLRNNRIYDNTYLGRFRCRGAGCPMRRGHFEAYVYFAFSPDAPYVGLVLLGARTPTSINCANVSVGKHAPDLAITGMYICKTTSPPEPAARLISEGELRMTRFRRPPN